MHDRSHKPQPPEAGEGAGGGNVDRVLFKNLVEMVPLVESLMDRRVNSAYSRRTSLVYTPAPPKKASELESVKLPQSVSAKKRRDPGDVSKKSTPDSNGDNGLVVPLSLSGAENKPKDDVAGLREQVDYLQKKLLEKEEALRSAESLVTEMNAAYATIDELRRLVSDKEALIRSTNSQLHDAKIMLADKQASVEKLEWEVKMSNKKVEDLQGDVSNMGFEISSLMAFFDKISENLSGDSYDDTVPSSYELEAIQSTSEIDKIEVDKIEQERITYGEALAAARENPDEEHLNIAAEARSRLQVLVL
ncbi:TMV-MP30 binding protein 2C [Zea mays]|uniref:Movement protein binding protein 2C n=1 Tax=Zea mays TaxID=4577 RepID=B4F8I6_MAIZE|nr:TMV-MP30 binding protein 2C [Zea mays]ACF78429.1 unknown [Zea mays]ACG31154.1 TMV-MP30 binding protein 2C [Zea mays]AQK83794.1 movement protein binding protein 2C [Zea mays]AQK83795.1 movement protein binding protein 2C [Zea mays]|eukprot:NP_001130261.1 TMV-MP30 binding protein 2C [Zea mays]